MGKRYKRKFKDYEDKQLDKTHPRSGQIEGSILEGHNFQTMKL